MVDFEFKRILDLNLTETFKGIGTGSLIKTKRAEPCREICRTIEDCSNFSFFVESQECFLKKKNEGNPIQCERKTSCISGFKVLDDGQESFGIIQGQ